VVKEVIVNTVLLRILIEAIQVYCILEQGRELGMGWILILPFLVLYTSKELSMQFWLHLDVHANLKSSNSSCSEIAIMF